MSVNRFHNGKLFRRYRVPGLFQHRRRLAKSSSVGDKNANSNADKHVRATPPSIWLILLCLFSPAPVIAFFSTVIAMVIAVITGPIYITAVPFMLLRHQQFHDPYFKTSSNISPLNKLYRVFLYGINAGLCPPDSSHRDLFAWLYDIGQSSLSLICRTIKFLLLHSAESFNLTIIFGHDIHRVRGPLRPLHTVYRVSLFGMMPCFVNSCNTHNTNNGQTTPAKVTERDIREQHKTLFSQKAFGITSDGTLPVDESQKSSRTTSKFLTQDQWHTIVHVVTNWKSKEEEKTLAKEEAAQFKWIPR